MGLSGYGAGRAAYLSFSSYYHSMILSLEGVVDTQDSVEIMRLLGRHTRPEVEITTGIVEGRNPPTPAVTGGQ